MNAMSVTWNDNAPIYRQLRDRVVAMILDVVMYAIDSGSEPSGRVRSY